MGFYSFSFLNKLSMFPSSDMLYEPRPTSPTQILYTFLFAALFLVFLPNMIPVQCTGMWYLYRSVLITDSRAVHFERTVGTSTEGKASPCT